MPIYEYECKQCGEPFEKMVPFSEADRLPVCPRCKSEDTRQKISNIFSSGASASASGFSSADSCGSHGGFT